MSLECIVRPAPPVTTATRQTKWRKHPRWCIMQGKTQHPSHGGKYVCNLATFETKRNLLRDTLPIYTTCLLVRPFLSLPNGCLFNSMGSFWSLLKRERERERERSTKQFLVFVIDWRPQNSPKSPLHLDRDYFVCSNHHHPFESFIYIYFSNRR